ncbi:MAG: hypothetical protein WCP96_15300 [Methylococcaceae bacterium]
MLAKPIIQRINQPSPDDVRLIRESLNLTQSKAAELVSSAKKAGYKTWAGYETPIGQTNHRVIPLAIWELFLLHTGQHPTLKLIKKY